MKPAARVKMMIASAALAVFPLVSQAQQPPVQLSETVQTAPAVTAPGIAVSGRIVSDGYSYGEYRDLVQSALLMDFYDLKSADVIDQYARLFYCDLYKEKFSDDFEWNKVRQSIQTRMLSQREYYRTLYQVSGPVNLDRYDFETQDFPLKDDSKLINVGIMNLMNYDLNDGKYRILSSTPCVDTKSKIAFPIEFKAQLIEPFTLDRLKIPADKARELLNEFDSRGDQDRKVYLRFRIRLISSIKTDPLVNIGIIGDIKFVAQLQSVDVFLNKDLTQYVFTVSLTKDPAKQSL